MSYVHFQSISFSTIYGDGQVNLSENTVTSLEVLEQSHEFADLYEVKLAMC